MEYPQIVIAEHLNKIESLLQRNLDRIYELEKELQFSKETVQELFNVIAEAKTNPVVLEMMNQENDIPPAPELSFSETVINRLNISGAITESEEN